MNESYLYTTQQAYSPMAYYLLSSFLIGGVLGIVHWAILASRILNF